MVAMKDLVARGWKSDNTFRGGYLGKVEEWPQKEFPRTDLKVNPHIQSNITAVKKSYNLLAKILDVVVLVSMCMEILRSIAKMTSGIKSLRFVMFN